MSGIRARRRPRAPISRGHPDVAAPRPGRRRRPYFLYASCMAAARGAPKVLDAARDASNVPRAAGATQLCARSFLGPPDRPCIGAVDIEPNTPDANLCLRALVRPPALGSQGGRTPRAPRTDPIKYDVVDDKTAKTPMRARYFHHGGPKHREALRATDAHCG